MKCVLLDSHPRASDKATVGSMNVLVSAFGKFVAGCPALTYRSVIPSGVGSARLHSSMRPFSLNHEANLSCDRKSSITKWPIALWVIAQEIDD